MRLCSLLQKQRGEPQKGLQMGLSPRRKPVNLLILGASSLSVITAGLLYCGYHRFRPVARQAGQIRHEAYVWQRHWDQVGAGGRQAPLVPKGRNKPKEAARTDKIAQPSLPNPNRQGTASTGPAEPQRLRIDDSLTPP
jgi:hypothetical protein